MPNTVPRRTGDGDPPLVTVPRLPKDDDESGKTKHDPPPVCTRTENAPATESRPTRARASAPTVPAQTAACRPRARLCCWCGAATCPPRPWTSPAAATAASATDVRCRRRAPAAARFCAWPAASRARQTRSAKRRRPTASAWRARWTTERVSKCDSRRKCRHASVGDGVACDAVSTAGTAAAIDGAPVPH